MRNRSYALFLIVFALVSHSASTIAENMFDTTTKELILPVVNVPGLGMYRATFVLTHLDTFQFKLKAAEPTEQKSRTAANYNLDSGNLSVPEIVVGEDLYDVEFVSVDDCSGICIKLNDFDDKGRFGSVIFNNTLTPGNTFTCSTCHAIEETDGFAMDGLRRPGHPLFNATRRSSYKNGQLNSMLDAVNTCVTEWMNGNAWTKSSQDWINLYNWLDDQATDESGKLVDIDIVSPPVVVTGGDAEIGQALFNKRCAICHGENGIGTQKAPRIVDIGLPESYIATRVRTSGREDSTVYTGLTGGIMPFWGSDRLSDTELINIIAYVSDGTTTPPTEDSEPVSSECTSNHAKIGQTAVLSTFAHNVSGIAEIIDDCTISIRNFNFDGNGIVVKVYLGSNGKFLESGGGIAAGANLVGNSYHNSTITVTLPDGVTLDNFNSISIWCVSVGVSFGDGLFM